MLFLDLKKKIYDTNVLKSVSTQNMKVVMMNTYNTYKITYLKIVITFK